MKTDNIKIILEAWEKKETGALNKELEMQNYLTYRRHMDDETQKGKIVEK